MSYSLKELKGPVVARLETNFFIVLKNLKMKILRAGLRSRGALRQILMGALFSLHSSGAKIVVGAGGVRTSY
jgi:hypothetical protein